jgi:hypothetical protein
MEADRRRKGMNKTTDSRRFQSMEVHVTKKRVMKGRLSAERASTARSSTGTSAGHSRKPYVTLELVHRLTRDIVVSGVIDEPDIFPFVKPFMTAIFEHGFPRGAVPKALAEAYGEAREAIDRLHSERRRGIRAPGPRWSRREAAPLEDVEVLRIFYPPRDERRGKGRRRALRHSRSPGRKRDGR